MFFRLRSPRVMTHPAAHEPGTAPQERVKVVFGLRAFCFPQDLHSCYKFFSVAFM